MTLLKNLSFAQIKDDILIDDNISGKGQESFEGKIFQFSSAEFPNWDAVCSELMI